jgi:hypothetical protein
MAEPAQLVFVREKCVNLPKLVRFLFIIDQICGNLLELRGMVFFEYISPDKIDVKITVWKNN